MPMLLSLILLLTTTTVVAMFGDKETGIDVSFLFLKLTSSLPLLSLNLLLQRKKEEK